jgi:hypothetical protein
LAAARVVVDRAGVPNHALSRSQFESDAAIIPSRDEVPIEAPAPLRTEGL